MKRSKDTCCDKKMRDLLLILYCQRKHLKVPIYITCIILYVISNYFKGIFPVINFNVLSISKICYHEFSVYKYMWY